MKIKALFISVLMTFSTFTFANSVLPNNQHLLFVQTAPHSTIEPMPHTPGIFIITLKPINSHVTYFAQRPARKSGLIPVAQFCKNWRLGHDSFDKDAPNADISAMPAGKVGLPINMPVVIIKMSENPKEHSVSYTFRPLIQENQDPVQLKPMHFGYTAIFIDDWCLSCI